jgi:hypothetical protein
MPAASAAQAAESLLADGEDDRHRQRFRPGVRGDRRRVERHRFSVPFN